MSTLVSAIALGLGLVLVLAAVAVAVALGQQVPEFVGSPGPKRALTTKKEYRDSLHAGSRPPHGPTY